MIEVDKVVKKLQLRRNLIEFKLMHDCLVINQETYSMFCMKYPKNRFDEYIQLLKTVKSSIDDMEFSLDNYDREVSESIYNGLEYIQNRLLNNDFYKNGMLSRTLQNLRDMLFNMLQWSYC